MASRPIPTSIVIRSNPATGAVIGSYAMGGPKEAQAAIEAAKRAFADALAALGDPLDLAGTGRPEARQGRRELPQRPLRHRRAESALQLIVEGLPGLSD
jgi:plasmid stabilization system protein ParE